MRVPWSSFLRSWWPVLAMMGINVIGGIYSMGYVAGRKSILSCALDAAREAKAPIEVVVDGR